MDSLIYVFFLGFKDPILLFAFVLSVLVVELVRIIWVSSMLELF